MNHTSSKLNLNVSHAYDGVDIRTFLNEFHLAKKTIHQLTMGNIWVNHERVTDRYMLHHGDLLTLDFQLREIKNIKPICHEKVDIVYEDDDLLIVNKPVGLLVYDDTNDKDNLTSRVACYTMNKGYTFSALPTHRLDEDTSGMIIYAKHPLSLAYISYLFETRQLEKYYHCLVLEPVIKEKMTITKPIGRDRHQNRMRINPSGLEAVTHYQLISHEGKQARLKVQIEGGRRHQIRVHLSSIGNPVVGDYLYGGIHAKRLMLHFCEVTFVHPLTREKVTFQSKADF